MLKRGILVQSSKLKLNGQLTVCVNENKFPNIEGRIFQSKKREVCATYMGGLSMFLKQGNVSIIKIKWRVVGCILLLKY